MGFWFFMFFNCLLIPGIQLLLGRIFLYHAPKNINPIFGYRTRRSTKNIETWQLAQAEFGRLSWRWGLIELPAALLGLLPVIGQDENTVGMVGLILCGLFGISIILIIWQVEKILKHTFDNKGNRII